MDSNVNEFYKKKIVITGASSGIGSCCSHYFLNCGAQVALVGRDVEGLKIIAKQYQKNATIIICDLTKDNNIYDLKKSIIEIFGSIDILINCAGLKLDSDIEKTFPQDYDYSININLRAVFLLIQNFSKFFNQNGSIVNVSCLYGTRPMPGLISFCMAKAGLEAFTKCVAGEFASDNIRVNCVSCCPLFSNSLRYVQTNEGENLLMEEKMKKNVPLGRMAYPSEPAKTIVFLCSKRASSITGQIIKVDGGRNLTSSGYVHYKGYINMNSRFEPDDENIWKKYNIFNFLKKKDENSNVIKKIEKMSDKELDAFINQTMKESNFSCDLEENNEENKEDIKSSSQNNLDNGNNNENNKDFCEKIDENNEENEYDNDNNENNENEKEENNIDNNNNNNYEINNENDDATWKWKF